MNALLSQKTLTAEPSKNVTSETPPDLTWHLLQIEDVYMQRTSNNLVPILTESSRGSSVSFLPSVALIEMLAKSTQPESVLKLLEGGVKATSNT